jgi:cobalt-zinc-cadmium efflux system outer membrane protein
MLEFNRSPQPTRFARLVEVTSRSVLFAASLPARKLFIPMIHPVPSAIFRLATKVASLALALSLPQMVLAQALTWQQVRTQFETNNPSLHAADLSVDESRAQEITAFLRPNPTSTVGLDQFDPISPNPYRPLAYLFPLVTTSYLHEREGKRDLRLESAQKNTEITTSQRADLERNLIFSLRGAFVQALQAKAILEVARDNLTYYDKLLGVSQDRLYAGDISQVDMQRLDLQRAQYESDVQTAEVSARNAKIQLLQLLNLKTPVDRFDITGTFEYSESILQPDELRRMALASRPDLAAAAEAVDKANTDHRLAIANGSTDPTFSADIGRNPPIPVYVGASVSVPLRIFDRNQGEKARTQIEIDRTRRLQEIATAQVYADIDSALSTLNGNMILLRAYKAKYLDEAAKVRDTISFAYQNGGASLLDFLNAQNEYRSIRLSYLNLVGSYFTAANQVNLSVGREVIQ